jgi:S-adenosylmethionine decarboxylase
MYKPGLHLISEFQVKNTDILKDSTTLKKYLDLVIDQHKLTKVGEVYHQFDGSGYTAVICLTESHISIHTWPEFNRVTFDVFLSNFMNYNNDIATSIHDGVLQLLQATEVQKTVLNR